jgi:hypothetical protein
MGTHVGHRRRSLCLATALSIAFIAAPASASLISFEFDGGAFECDTTGGTEERQAFKQDTGLDCATGWANFAGRFTIDTEASSVTGPPSYLIGNGGLFLSEEGQIYSIDSPGTGLSISIGNLTLFYSEYLIQMVRLEVDVGEFVTALSIHSPEFQPGFAFTFGSSNGSLFSEFTLEELVNTQLSQFSGMAFSDSAVSAYVGTPNWRVIGGGGSIRVQSVAEPSTLALLCIGLLCIGFAARRRSQLAESRRENPHHDAMPASIGSSCRRRLLLTASLAVMSISTSVPTLAAPITYEFTGMLPTEESGYCWFRSEDSSTNICGQQLYGYFTVDDDPVNATDTRAEYFSSGGPYGMFVSVADQIGWSSEISILLLHNDPVFIIDEVDHVRIQTGGTDPDNLLVFFSLWFGAAGDFFNEPPRIRSFPTSFEFQTCAILRPEGCTIAVGQSWADVLAIHDWTFTRSASVIPIPAYRRVSEPGTLSILCVGLVLLGFSGWRQSGRAAFTPSLIGIRSSSLLN